MSESNWRKSVARSIPPEIKKKIRKLRGKKSIRKIATELGVSTRTVQDEFKRQDMDKLASKKKAAEDQLNKEERYMSLDMILKLTTLESYVAGQCDQIVKDMALIDSITNKQIEDSDLAYKPDQRLGIRRMVIKTLNDTHTMLSMSKMNELPEQQQSMVGELTALMDLLADTPEKREAALALITKAAEDGNDSAGDATTDTKGTA